MRKGILFVLSGPSGAGKGTVLSKVKETVPGLAYSVSATTRKPRLGEIDGIHYYFKSDSEFDKMVENNEFLEYINKFRHKYGTPRLQVEKHLEEGVDVILEIETNGAVNVKKLFPEAVFIFITPSTYEELTKRLTLRGTETEAALKLRLKTAQIEYKSIKEYQYIAINDDLEKCIETVKAIIVTERAKLENNKDVVENFANLYKNKSNDKQ